MSDPASSSEAAERIFLAAGVLLLVLLSTAASFLSVGQRIGLQQEIDIQAAGLGIIVFLLNFRSWKLLAKAMTSVQVSASGLLLGEEQRKRMALQLIAAVSLKIIALAIFFSFILITSYHRVVSLLFGLIAVLLFGSLLICLIHTINNGRRETAFPQSS